MRQRCCTWFRNAVAVVTVAADSAVIMSLAETMAARLRRAVLTKWWVVTLIIIIISRCWMAALPSRQRISEKEKEIREIYADVDCADGKWLKRRELDWLSDNVWSNRRSKRRLATSDKPGTPHNDRGTQAFDCCCFCHNCRCCKTLLFSIFFERLVNYYM